MIITPTFIKDGFFDEYPRPQFKRDSFFNLCGEWDYAITAEAAEPASYDGKILVPFSPESPLSGVSRQLQKDQFLHLKKDFVLPGGFNRGRVFLNVGAIDQCAKIYLNGVLLCEHNDGYNSFTVELTPICEGKNTLYILVTDDADSPVYGRGKQRYKRGGIWYTATSGIWQPIWIESTPVERINSFKLYPDLDNKKLRILFDLTDGEKSVYVSIIDQNRVISSGQSRGGEVVLDCEGCLPWSPDSPNLYGLEMSYGEDRVESYFGLRKFSVLTVDGKKYFALNNKPIFHNGLLDQGYYKDGIYTPHDNEEMYRDVVTVKKLGYNMLRKHIKVEPFLWYYYCDAAGILVWQDMINGGDKYPTIRINLKPFINYYINDHNYRRVRRALKESRDQYLIEANRLIDALFNCVSLCLWTPFNECWGQFDAALNCKILQEKDPTRHFDHASGWQDKGAGDVKSRHIYFRKARPKNDKKRVLALTEFGGYSMHIADHAYSPKEFGYKRFKDKAKLTKAYEGLYLNEVIPAIVKQGLSASCYTQLTDVEDEVNGILTYDRILKLDGDAIARVNEAVYEAFDQHVNK